MTKSEQFWEKAGESYFENVVKVIADDYLSAAHFLTPTAVLLVFRESKAYGIWQVTQRVALCMAAERLLAFPSGIPTELKGIA